MNGGDDGLNDLNHFFWEMPLSSGKGDFRDTSKYRGTGMKAFISIKTFQHSSFPSKHMLPADSNLLEQHIID